ncbi:Protein translocase subunit SecE [Buchnera aphidicola (Cinara piceae)]|uniref:Protein translocase subunit SecE n=1 Tax=Buchnera aphidicola (Cinara piceae) TaxID=1660043 RepID=A0A803GCJ4_9GAMM|nr:preprotein translocase subunit SecE [Buchnera aphidicola]VFP87820.1 Protein translocase subunit SecE [Buchnera aphidicola (Cinara piceae)]
MHLHNIYKIYMNHTEKIKWFCIITIILSIILNYIFFLNKSSQIFKILFFSTLLILLINIFIRTIISKKIFIFINEIKLELSNIVWPSYKETSQITGIVILLIILTSVFLWILDGIILRVMSCILAPRL